MRVNAATTETPNESAARRFEGRAVIVTGGTSGIGLATARRMCAEGGRVCVVGRHDDQGEQAEAELRAHGDALFVRGDVAREDDIASVVSRVVSTWGRIDVLVNNAAIMTFDPVVELSTSDWDHVLDVNLRGAFLFAKLSLPHMPSGSAIVNVSSVHAHETTIGVAPYAASKGGLEAFTRVLSRELMDRHIRVNCVAPGAVDTPMLWSNPNVASGREHVEGAIGAPEDIAAAIAFMAAPEARFVTGTTLIVDGGRLDRL